MFRGLISMVVLRFRTILLSYSHCTLRFYVCFYWFLASEPKQIPLSTLGYGPINLAYYYQVPDDSMRVCFGENIFFRVVKMIHEHRYNKATYRVKNQTQFVTYPTFRSVHVSRHCIFSITRNFSFSLEIGNTENDDLDTR